jgi:hypothetical protein
MANKLEINVVCIRIDDGFGEDAYMTVNRVIQECKPDKWEFLNPTTFMVYFKSKSNGERKAKELINTIETHIQSHPFLNDLTIGSSSGEMLATCSLFGKILEGPYGEVGNQAINQAKAKGNA